MNNLPSYRPFLLGVISGPTQDLRGSNPQANKVPEWPACTSGGRSTSRVQRFFWKAAQAYARGSRWSVWTNAQNTVAKGKKVNWSANSIFLGINFFCPSSSFLLSHYTVKNNILATERSQSITDLALHWLGSYSCGLAKGETEAEEEETKGLSQGHRANELQKQQVTYSVLTKMPRYLRITWVQWHNGLHTGLWTAKCWFLLLSVLNSS